MFSLIRETLTQLIACLKLGRRLLWRLAVRPRSFGRLKQISEDPEMQLFTYRLGLLAPPAGVAKQRLTVTVGEQSPQQFSLSPMDESVEFKAGPVGEVVTLSLDYLDDAGNDSANLEMEFAIEDKIAPAMPEGFGDLAQVAEENVE